MKYEELKNRLFNIQNQKDFESLALAIFSYQFEHIELYGKFCQVLNRTPNQVKALEDIPFLPIEFFKTHQILKNNSSYEEIFTSSGTTGMQTSKHYVSDLEIYEKSFKTAFRQFYGEIEDYVVLALLPSYLERKGSSLIYMADHLIKDSKHPQSGFYLDNLNLLSKNLKELDKSGQKVLLLGVSFALLDLVEKNKFSLQHTIIMETGGMKGRRKELTREELHTTLKEGFGVKHIHSEYGMTELLSQAYSKGDGLFYCPKTMQVLIREPEDPLNIVGYGKNGGINILDLANINSCSFIATQDLGRRYKDGSFEVLGRFDHSDIRGCNLMVL